MDPIKGILTYSTTSAIIVVLISKYGVDTGNALDALGMWLNGKGLLPWSVVLLSGIALYIKMQEVALPQKKKELEEATNVFNIATSNLKQHIQDIDNNYVLSINGKKDREHSREVINKIKSHHEIPDLLYSLSSNEIYNALIREKSKDAQS